MMELWDTEAWLREILSIGMEARGRKEMGKAEVVRYLWSRGIWGEVHVSCIR